MQFVLTIFLKNMELIGFLLGIQRIVLLLLLIEKCVLVIASRVLVLKLPRNVK